jgi:hypothetical protein
MYISNPELTLVLTLTLAAHMERNATSAIPDPGRFDERGRRLPVSAVAGPSRSGPARHANGLISPLSGRAIPDLIISHSAHSLHPSNVPPIQQHVRFRKGRFSKGLCSSGAHCLKECNAPRRLHARWGPTKRPSLAAARGLTEEAGRRHNPRAWRCLALLDVL